MSRKELIILINLDKIVFAQNMLNKLLKAI